MSESQVSTRTGSFEMIPGAHADRWGFDASAYEATRHDSTLAALPRARYRTGCEIGCSIGMLTQRLAQRCNRLLAVDVAPEVLDRARTRCRDLPQVRFALMEAPDELPDAQFDLIVLSDVGFSWSVDALALVRCALTERLVPGGHLLLVHWTPRKPRSAHACDQVHDAFLQDSGPQGPLSHLTDRREETYRLDLFERRSAMARMF